MISTYPCYYQDLLLFARSTKNLSQKLKIKKQVSASSVSSLVSVIVSRHPVKVIFISFWSRLRHNVTRTGQSGSTLKIAQLSKVIAVLLWFCFTTLCDWFRNLAPLSQPIRCKTKTNHDLVACVFPRLAPMTCICFNFSLVHCVVYVFCDWSMLLLWFWFWFHDTQLKSSLMDVTDFTSTRNDTHPSRYWATKVIFPLLPGETNLLKNRDKECVRLKHFHPTWSKPGISWEFPF